METKVEIKRGRMKVVREKITKRRKEVIKENMKVRKWITLMLAAFIEIIFVFLFSLSC